jgi:MFS family permease
VQTSSPKTLAILVSIFFFTNNLSGTFLTVYYKQELGLSIAEIAAILLFTFPLIGLLPILLLRKIRNFERIISWGIFFTMLFYIILSFVKNPVVLGIAYGLSIATFWPSFNLLQFRLSETKVRARTISLFSSVIPSLASIIGPAVGGFIIESFEFHALFAVAVALYLVAFLLSVRIRFGREACGFSVPRSKKFAVFFVSFVLLGLTESYWVAYPLFILSVSGTIFNMGLVLALSAIIISMVTFLVNWLSDIKRARVVFAIIGVALNAAWYAALSFASTTYEVVALSMVSGLGGAFSISWFAFYGDSFEKHSYASILVLMETGLMIGRVLNLLPTYMLVSVADYATYFRLLALILPFLIPLYMVMRRVSRD